VSLSAADSQADTSSASSRSRPTKLFVVDVESAPGIAFIFYFKNADAANAISTTVWCHRGARAIC
jgi:hypothetical protein